MHSPLRALRIIRTFFIDEGKSAGPGLPYMIAVHAAYVGLQLCPLRRGT